MKTVLSRRSVVRAFPFVGALALAPVIMTKELKAAPQPTSPGVRLYDAIAEAKAALAEIYGCEVKDLSQSIKGSGVIVLSAMPHPMDRVKWFVDDGSPLLPSEAAWAKYEADRKRLAPKGSV